MFTYSMPKFPFRGHSFSRFVKFFEKHTCVFKGERNVSSSENFVNVLNE